MPKQSKKQTVGARDCREDIYASMRDVGSMADIQDALQQARDRINSLLLLLRPHFDGDWGELVLTRGDVTASIAISEGTDDLVADAIADLEALKATAKGRADELAGQQLAAQQST